MNATVQRNQSDELGGTTAEKPGAANHGKLPITDPGVMLEKVPKELRNSWVTYMTRGFENNQVMFQRTLNAFMWPYTIMVGMYVTIFIVGVLFFTAAVYLGLAGKQPILAGVFGGLSIISFLMFFVRQPIQAITINLEYISWLGVAFNTYWTRLMYISNEDNIQKALKSAADDYCAMVERIIHLHSKWQETLPGGKLKMAPAPQKPVEKPVEEQADKKEGTGPANAEDPKPVAAPVDH